MGDAETSKTGHRAKQLKVQSDASDVMADKERKRQRYLMAALQGSSHDIDISDALKGVVNTTHAIIIGHLHNDFLHVHCRLQQLLMLLLAQTPANIVCKAACSPARLTVVLCRRVQCHST